MAEYSAAQMDESLAEEVLVAQSAPKPWRRFGLVAAALGTVGAVVGMTRPRVLTPVQQMHQMAHMSHSFLQAFVERALSDTETLTVDMGLTFAEAGVEPKVMTIEAYLRPAENTAKNPEKPHITVAFNAKADQGKALKDQFQKVLDTGKEHLNEKSDGAGAALDMVSVSSHEDKVYIRITPPPMGVSKKDEKRLTQGMEAKPTLKFSVGTGRDFEQMVANIHTCPSTLPGGFTISASTQLAEALFETLEQVAGKVDAGHARTIAQAKEMLGRVDSRGVKPLEGISSLSSQSTVRYNKEALEAATCDKSGEGERKEQVEGAKMMLQQMLPEGTRKAAAGLAEYADSLHFIRFTGFLPDDYELRVDFTNFKLTPVIKEFLQQPARAPPGDAEQAE